MAKPASLLIPFPPGPVFLSYSRTIQNLLFDVRRGDYVLHPADIPVLQELIDASQPRLEHVARELKQVTTQKTALEAEATELTTILTASRSALSHIRKLPLNILLEIFEYLLPRFPDEETDNWGTTKELPTCLNRHYGAWLIMRVCRKWRFVCQTTPWLWTDVYVRLECERAAGRSCGSCFASMSGRLRQYLSMSRRASSTSVSAPPTMRLRIDAGSLNAREHQCKSVNMVPDLLARENGRWSSINIRCTVGLATGSKLMFDILKQLMGPITRPPFGCLQTLNCAMDTQYQKSASGRGNSASSAAPVPVVRYYGPMQDLELPQLNSARFCDTVTFTQVVHSLRPNIFPWSKIEYLTLKQVSARVVLEILPHIADTVCLLNLISIRPPVGKGPGLMPAQRKEHLCTLDIDHGLAIPARRGRTILKNLRTLQLNPPCSIILDSIDCPNLFSFGISEQPGQIVQPLPDAVSSTAAFLKRNPATTNTLTLAIKLKEAQYVKILKNVVNVRMLQVLWPADHNALIEVIGKTEGKGKNSNTKLLVLPNLFSFIVFGHAHPDPVPSVDARKVWELMKMRSQRPPKILRNCHFMSIPPDYSGWGGEDSVGMESVKEEMERLRVNLAFTTSDDEDSDGESDDSESGSEA